MRQVNVKCVTEMRERPANATRWWRVKASQDSVCRSRARRKVLDYWSHTASGSPSQSDAREVNNTENSPEPSPRQPSSREETQTANGARHRKHCLQRAYSRML